MNPTKEVQTAYLAHEGYAEQLRSELVGIEAVHGRLFVCRGPEQPSFWAANVWRNPQRYYIASIGDGAKRLRALQRNWVELPSEARGRAELLAAKLPHVSKKPLRFPDAGPQAPLGSWTLLDRETLFAASDCSSPYPNGEVHFEEDREAPPSRAYLKAWEALVRRGETPQPGQLCLDLGSSPGGWTWAVQQTGARVISVDKAPIDPAIAALPRVEYRQQSAFALDPTALGQVDWLFSDVACYPQRLLELVRRWLAAGTCERFVCTLKFQGPTDHAVSREFAAIPGSRLMHLSHNKHELTWML